MKKQDEIPTTNPSEVEALIKRIESSPLPESDKQLVAEHLKKIGSGARIQSPAFVEGQIAYYTKKYDEALTKAAEAVEAIPWLYEAKKLEGEAYLLLGQKKRVSGDVKGALADYEKAGRAFESAAETARSDSSCYEGIADQWINVMLVRKEVGGSMKEPFSAAMAAFDNALKADPDNSRAYSGESYAYFIMGEYELFHGGDPRPTLNEAAEQSIHLNPKDPEPYRNRGDSFLMRANYEARHGVDPRASTAKAVESYNQARLLNPNSVLVLNNLMREDDGIGPKEYKPLGKLWNRSKGH